MIAKLKAACRTNEPQVVMVGFFTALNVLAITSKPEPAPIWLWCVAIFVWPLMAYLGNLSEQF